MSETVTKAFVSAWMYLIASAVFLTGSVIMFELDPPWGVAFLLFGVVSLSWGAACTGEGWNRRLWYKVDMAFRKVEDNE